MNKQHGIADAQARLRALDPSMSFIVQAPAGSGKTGLLTQRYLVLLSVVNTPEEIIAITFTRKAASEMRVRILQALENGMNDQPLENDYEKHTWELARKALSRNTQQGWELLETPARLRIQTIDSLCASLAGQMPVLSRFGSTPVVTENAAALYQQAARNTIADLNLKADWSDAIAHLIQHLDNRLELVESLLADMLARRDQWLRHLGDSKHAGLERQTLEAAMTRLTTEFLHELCISVPVNYAENLVMLARFAASNLELSNSTSSIRACADLLKLPGKKVEDRFQWEGLAELLLTQSGDWRKTVNVKQGFPAAGQAINAGEKAQFTAMKTGMLSLLTSLQDEEGFRQRLNSLRSLPASEYSNEDWMTLSALLVVLRIACAHLELVFRKQGEVDFPALSQAAIRALGNPDAPTDLALALDYRIQHLLIDEFQDTSFNQYELLQRLTAGWQLEDGHTLFVVGDPMQSIYRFREAEVGLFLAAWKYGIGHVKLEPLRLSVNFRSQQGIVDWINQSFPSVLHEIDNTAAGGVSYAPSTAFHSAMQGAAVIVHPSIAIQRDHRAEAVQVIALVQQAKEQHPQGTIAILVRGRNHLVETVAALQKAGMRFQAVEISRLSQRPVIQDLMALTRALSHQADRIAWLSVLRAPYCGLSLQDLYALAGTIHDQLILDKLQQEECIDQLSEEGRARISRVLPVLKIALTEQQRRSLRSTVEGAWIALGGPACVNSETDLEDAEVYLQLLESLDTDGMLEPHDLATQVDSLFALPDVHADNRLQLMTIHKSKGLEFDTVILPGLDRPPRRDDEKLLDWLELSRESGESELLLAPIRAYGDDKNRMAVYLQNLNKQKALYENGRLLYVAATRAKRRLHLLGHVAISEKEDAIELKAPNPGSLLAQFWPVLSHHFEAFLGDYSINGSDVIEQAEPRIPDYTYYRLPIDYHPPAPPESIAQALTTMERASVDVVEFDWASETARHTGTVVHRLLQYVGKAGIETIGFEHHEHFRKIAHSMLIQLGVPQGRLKETTARVFDAIQSSIQDRFGQWILSGQHANAECELAISAVRMGRVVRMVIDRTFIDDKGNRWIIDYKTGSHSGSDVEEFLRREQERYRKQLEGYAEVMSRIESRPIHLGIYFPLLSQWRTWRYEPVRV